MESIKRETNESIIKIIVILLYCILAAGFLYAGVGLIYSGIKGDWQISMEWQGWKLYASSLFPGIAVCFSSLAIVIWGLPSALKKFK